MEIFFVVVALALLVIGVEWLRPGTLARIASIGSFGGIVVGAVITALSVASLLASKYPEWWGTGGFWRTMLLNGGMVTLWLFRLLHGMKGTRFEHTATTITMVSCFFGALFQFWLIRNGDTPPDFGAVSIVAWLWGLIGDLFVRHFGIPSDTEDGKHKRKIVMNGVRGAIPAMIIATVICVAIIALNLGGDYRPRPDDCPNVEAQVYREEWEFVTEYQRLGGEGKPSRTLCQVRPPDVLELCDKYDRCTGG